jgi:aminoglycoside phosphotransferase (APT) family kinase protein
LGAESWMPNCLAISTARLPGMTSTSQWTAERTVGVARAAELLSTAFPQLRGLRVVPLAEGWDNTVHVVGGEWAFRFPRRAIALSGFRRELAVLARIAPLLPLPVPVPELVAKDDDPVDPWPFAGARLIHGRELADTGLPDEARTAAASKLGAFLRTLHAQQTRAAVEVDLPVDPLQRAWPRARAQNIGEQLDRLVADETWTGDPAVQSLLAQAEQLETPAGDPVLVHGDLHVRHLLVNDAGGAADVIDWGDVCMADPAVDLALAYAAFTGAARAALLSAYGPIDAERELRARALAIRLSALLAGYAAAVDRPALLIESLAGLRRAVE